MLEEILQCLAASAPTTAKTGKQQEDEQGELPHGGNHAPALGLAAAVLQAARKAAAFDVVRAGLSAEGQRHMAGFLAAQPAAIQGRAAR
jgi:hypothetical protein